MPVDQPTQMEVDVAVSKPSKGRDPVAVANLGGQQAKPAKVYAAVQAVVAKPKPKAQVTQGQTKSVASQTTSKSLKRRIRRLKLKHAKENEKEKEGAQGSVESN